MTIALINSPATESLLAFWRDAGVDACYLDAPSDRTLVQPLPALKAISRATAGVSVNAGPGMTPDEGLIEARRLAADAATLDDLAKAIATFEGCPLSSMGARRAVFCRGNPSGDVLIIGEAPGTEEEERGQPFVGKAGRLLDRILAAANLQDRAFITNTVFWRPPGNRTPTPQEQALCAPFVERALALLKPRAVLLLGAAASKSVLQADEGIMKLRGQWREWRLAEGGISAPVMPTLHPAFLLRQPQAKAHVWADILSLAARLDTPQDKA